MSDVLKRCLTEKTTQLIIISDVWSFSVCGLNPQNSTPLVFQASTYLTQVRKYTEIKELDAEIIRTFVERIDVFKPEKVPGTRTKKQTVLIHWNFIGAVELPQEQEKSA
ncbi:MAG: DUF4368 domain-containing protein [Clostridia bacterium]|nr:DUF4368 domain-containing protein [Clostridia bacterium]